MTAVASAALNWKELCANLQHAIFRNKPSCGSRRHAFTVGLLNRLRVFAVMLHSILFTTYHNKMYSNFLNVSSHNNRSLSVSQLGRVSSAARLRAGRPRNRDTTSGRDTKHKKHEGSGVNPSRGVKLTTHLQLIARSTVPCVLTTCTSITTGTALLEFQRQYISCYR
jgi:hypothetical protein